MIRKFYKGYSDKINGGYNSMAIVTIIGCAAAAVVGLTQVYKGVSGAVEAYKQMRLEKEEEVEEV